MWTLSASAHSNDFYGHHTIIFPAAKTFSLLVMMISVVASQPEFTELIPNATVAIGRDAVLQCTVDNLENYKVAWIKMDTQTLLSIHKHVITRDKRIKVTNNNLQWNLHISKVDEKDKGYYMCQINTEPMVSQLGYLDVMVPPTIIETGTSSDTVTEERSKVSLRCEASGYPEPIITWRREDGKDINLGSYGGRKYSALRVEGEFLNISQVSREDMGAYLCIASNGVLPAVSKRILLQVNFKPKIRVPNQLVGAASGSDVVLECRLEASPTPLTSWIRSEGIMLLNNKKYDISEMKDGYKINMKIKIFSLTVDDFGSYKCVAKNTLGEKEGFIRLYEIPPPTSNPKVTQHYEVYLPRLRDKNLRSSVSETGASEDSIPSKPLHRPPENGATSTTMTSLSILACSWIFINLILLR
ncbi:lachesin-like isoform X2 [Parasteatoda tepidariorum]|uniref:lachesin-like isoform X2 n=1 Tax=Parasteatoda tepidariorum TaxID=114398 RepID=UPI00077FD25D|nr:lachesin-like isoform X2 [Parasteatoda tepidariorum]